MSIEKSIEKDYGEGVIIDASFILGQEKKIISISPSVDIGIDGGVPQGSWVILSGPEKVGKTTAALTLARNAQKIGMKVIYHNIEHRLKRKNLEGISGLNIPNIKVVESVQGKILTAEDHLDIAERYLKTQPEIVLVLDSASALCSENEMTDKISGQIRSIGPKLLASFCRRNESIVPVQNSIVIIIQHLIANTSGYGAKNVEDGGNKIKYQADIKLRCTHAEKWVKGEDEIGKVLHWNVVESALGRPGRKVESYLRYGYGVDDVMELIVLGADIGIISKAGAWYTYGENRFQGQENMREFLTQNHDIRNKLYDEIRSSL